MSDVRYVVLGAGGLGCPALLGLLSAGARHVTIIDDDRVDASNLARQVLYTTADVGAHKAQAAGWNLRSRVPSLEVDAQVRRIEPGQAKGWVESLSPGAIVLECSDDPALKFAINDALVGSGRRGVIGAALGLRSQVLALAPGTACYRCIYESPPSDAPSCAGAGVLGPGVGVAGFLMASLAVSLGANVAETAGRLTAIDNLSASVVTLAPHSRPDCAACHSADKPTARPVHHEPVQDSRPPRAITR